MKKVFFDTNFFMLPHQFGIDVFDGVDNIINEKYEIVTSSGVVEELKKIQEGGGRDSISAQVALKLIEEKGIKIMGLEHMGDVDKSILKSALENNAIVCTNDKKLKKMLRENKISIICLRGKDKLICI